MQDPIYAIGDIHGQYEMLLQALELIEADGGPGARTVFLGDYTDRGPQSREVLAHLIAGRAAGRDWHFIMGNHDRMFAWFLQEVPRHDPHLPVELYWLHPRLGGDTTLASYGVEFSPRSRLSEVHRAARAAVPEAHRRFLEEARLSHETEELFFCHAGIRPGVGLAEQAEEDLLWIRKPFHESRADHPKLVVHGHTPIGRATHYGNRVNLDTDAGHGRRLSVALFEGQECWLLTQKGRQPLRP